MVTAIVLITAEAGAVPDLAPAVADIAGVGEVYSVGGRYDLVAVVRVAALEDLERVVTRTVDRLPGVAASETLIAFRAFAPNAVEAGFALGFPDAD